MINSSKICEKIIQIMTAKEKGVTARFGDGDLYLADGSFDINQQATDGIKKEMIETIGINDSNYMRFLPLVQHQYGGIEPGMTRKDFIMAQRLCENLCRSAQKHWKGPMNQVYNAYYIAYMACYKPQELINFFLTVGTLSDMVIFVGNEKANTHIFRKLWSKTYKHHIKTPEKNAYSVLDDIEKKTIKFLKENSEKYILIIAALGCSGRILGKRLWQSDFTNFFYLDFSSLIDAYDGKVTRRWIRETFGKSQFKSLLNKLNS